MATEAGPSLVSEEGEAGPVPAPAALTSGKGAVATQILQPSPVAPTPRGWVGAGNLWFRHS